MAFERSVTGLKSAIYFLNSHETNRVSGLPFTSLFFLNFCKAKFVFVKKVCKLNFVQLWTYVTF